MDFPNESLERDEPANRRDRVSFSIKDETLSPCPSSPRLRRGGAPEIQFVLVLEVCNKYKLFLRSGMKA
jgi:hypothetical protein